MSWIGEGDQLILPCCDEKIGMNSQLQNSSSDIPDFDMNYSKKFIQIGDSLFCNQQPKNSKIAAGMYYSAPHSLNNGLKSSAQIKDHIKDVKKYNSQNATHVLTFGFDDIRFNENVKPSEIATQIADAYKDAAEEVKNQGIKLWCITIPEIGDLDAEFREFNNCLRRAAVEEKLGEAKLFDLAAAALSRPNSTYKERHHMLYSFFEQQLGMKLMKDDKRTKFPALQDPDNYIVQKDSSDFNREQTPIITTENAPSEVATAANDQKQNPAVQIDTGNPIADTLASMYLRVINS